LRGGISCLLPGETEERELGWLDWSWVADVSADARLVLFSEEHAGGAPKGAVYLRATDGSPAVRLGDGDAEGLSPDGKWALTKSRERPQWVLLPTGAGSPRTLPRGNLVVALSHGDWLPDARRIVFSARDEGGAVRGYVQDIEDGALRPLTPPGVDIRLDAATPDGKYVTAWMGGRHLLFPVAGGEPRPTAYLTPDDSTVQWSADGRFLYVRTGGAAPAQLDRIDMKTGSRKAWKTLMPRDPSGIERVYPIVITPDGRAYCYSYARTLNDLYLVEGLR
jgi:hypothetical protein